MPKYTFRCECGEERIKFVPVSVETAECEVCKAQMTRLFPNIVGQTEIKEVVDPYTNTKWGKDHEAVMKDRRAQHFKDVEIPRLVEKYSIETCLENKWLVYNDKGELVINKNWIPSSKV